ncbi:hypothetical protein ACQR1W_31170 [Bradyrhizobium sp. HKCCYLS1011]|uniref:hypothetical protein n=1 Tax=Bradyrhizobium sp. HKCCYLS1011 TaxID=3420733 RepID=UPI003EBB752D
MAVPSSGAVGFSTVNAVFGYGNHMSQYAGRVYYYTNGVSTLTGNFPTSNFHMSQFYGKSGHDEWNCACNCDCACGK